MDYIDVYKRRLNRYGLDYQSRVQGQRDRNFDNYLLKSIYRVDFWYNDIYVPATLERYKQDHTETQCYLLTRRDVQLPNGTIIETENMSGEKKIWMVWWLEQIEQSGYNKYIVLRMTHRLTWRDSDNLEHTQWAYFYGPGKSTIADTLKSASGEAIYRENDKLNMFITPYHSSIKLDLYFECPYEETAQAYVVTGFDVNSTPGVEYVSVDPTYVRDGSAPVIRPAGETESTDGSDEYFWLEGSK